MADINLNIALTIQEATKNLQNFTTQATKSLGAVEKEMGGLNSSFAQVTKNTGITNLAMGSFFGTTLAGLGLKVLDATISAVKELAEAFIVDGVKGAIAADEAVKGLEASLISSGRYTETSTDSFEKFANSLQKTTRFTDDAVISTAALISSYSSLTEDGLKKATQAALDFSTRFRVDVDTAARLVGKAAEGNIEAFKKYGISIKDTGDKAKNFSLILDEVARKSGNAAVAAGSTFAGGLDKLKNNFDDATKSFGKLIINNEGVIKGIATANEVVSKLAVIVQNNKDKLNDWITRLAYMTETIIIGTVKGIENLITGFNKLSDFFDLHKGGFDSMRTAQKQFIDNENVVVKDFVTGKDIQLGKINDINNAILKASVIQNQASGEILVNIGKESEENQKLATSKENLLAVERKEAAEKSAAREKQQNETREAQLKEVNGYYERANLLRAIDEKKNADDIAAFTTKGDLILEERTLQTQQELKDLQAKYDQTLLIESGYQTSSQEQEQKALSAKIVQKELALNQELRASNEQRSKEQKAKEDADAKDRAMKQKALSNASNFFGNLASVGRLGNKDLFEIAKAANLAQAIANGALAVTQAQIAAPPPYNYALMAAAAIAAGVEIALISSTHLAGGMTSIPKGFQGDNFPAMLQTGERVVTAAQNKDLTSFLESNNSDSGILSRIDAKLNAMLNRPIVITVSGREIFRTVDDELRGGRVFST